MYQIFFHPEGGILVACVGHHGHTSKSLVIKIHSAHVNLVFKTTECVCLPIMLSTVISPCYLLPPLPSNPAPNVKCFRNYHQNRYLNYPRFRWLIQIKINVSKLKCGASLMMFFLLIDLNLYSLYCNIKQNILYRSTNYTHNRKHKISIFFIIIVMNIICY